MNKDMRSLWIERINSGTRQHGGPIAGFRSVLRTLVYAFLASYEISLQLGSPSQIDIGVPVQNLLRRVWGQTVLCTHFKYSCRSHCAFSLGTDSIVDVPIRCLLSSLEGEFPFRAAELLCMLSALAEDAWPAQCVYDFLDKSVGVASLLKISRYSVVDASLKIVKTNKPLHVPGIEGFRFDYSEQYQKSDCQNG